MELQVFYWAVFPHPIYIFFESGPLSLTGEQGCNDCEKRMGEDGSYQEYEELKFNSIGGVCEKITE